MSGETDLTELCGVLEAEIQQARRQGDIPALLAAAAAAMDRLEAAAAEPALKLAMRIGYNVAADVYPGWESGTPARSAAEYAQAQALAERSRGLVARLGMGPMQRGNAVWLIGALELARGRRAEALPWFAQAADRFVTLPEMRLMAQGFAAISSGGALEPVLAELDALATEDALFFRGQLAIALERFGPPAAS